MSDGSYASISVTPHEGEGIPTPTVLRVIGVWNHHVSEYRFYHDDDGAEIGYASDALSEFGDGITFDENDGSVSFTTDTKYEIEQFLDVAAHLSRTYPQARVVVHREWTGDGEPATEMFIWDGGDLVRNTTDSALPTGYAGTAKSLADTLTDDIGRDYLSSPEYHTALLGTINRTIEFLRSLT